MSVDADTGMGNALSAKAVSASASLSCVRSPSAARAETVRHCPLEAIVKRA